MVRMEGEHQEVQSDTRHEPHEHAYKRLLVGFVTIVLLGVFFFYVWPYWGDAIQEACLGDGEVCGVSLPGTAVDDTQK